jgi:hypothetical protein
VELVVTELASNMVKHAKGGGDLLVRTMDAENPPGIEVLALDHGPGMKDLAGSMRDGYSTAGSLGTGLGAVRRLSSLFDAYAPPGGGAAVLSRIWAHPPAPLTPPALTFGGLSLPAPGETVCGDAWLVHETAGRVVLLVADGLGHGAGAALAADEALAAFRRDPSRGPQAQLTAIDAALRPTRGAAVAVAEVLPDAHDLLLAGLGNISVRLGEGDTLRGLATNTGTAGMGIHVPHTSTHAWTDDAILVMHSDGLGTHWDLGDYAGLRRRHPSLIAGVLLRDHTRGKDDVTILVATAGRRAQ